MIQIQQVTKRYPNGHEALRNIDLVVAGGEMVFLTGHSGAGKSTLLKLITLTERSSRGQIRIGGQFLDKLQGRSIARYRQNLGVVFQDHRLLSDRTVFDNVALPLVIAGMRHQDIGRRVRAALDNVGLLNKERSQPLMLSSGEQQRVGIARAIVHKPALVLADEPTGNLDPDLSLEIMQLFSRFNQVGVTVIVASHDLSLIHGLEHRILRLREGRLVAAESPS